MTTFLYTIPSLALFELLVAPVGPNVITAEIALVSYTLLILFRNTLTGLREVPSEVLDAAEGMGMARTQALLRVELPLALPAIVAGLRIAIVTIIALATIVYTIYNARPRRADPRRARRGTVQDGADRRGRPGDHARAARRRLLVLAAARAHAVGASRGVGGALAMHEFVEAFRFIAPQRRRSRVSRGCRASCI